MDRLAIGDVDVRRKLVFVRVDFNVPLAEGRISDDTRIRGALPTIKKLIESEARIVLASHLGRPKGTPDPKLSLKPVARALSGLLGASVGFVAEAVGPNASARIAELGYGQVLLLENLRFHAGEKANDPEFSKALAAGVDVYVDDAFGAAHRAHASVVGITSHVPVACMGLLMEKELAALTRVRENPRWPFALIVGGAKVSDKLPVIEGLLPKINELIIGGGMAYTFLKSMGVGVGRSLVEDDRLEAALAILVEAEKRGIDVSLPVDHVAAERMEAGVATRVVESDMFPDELMGLDIGPITLLRYKEKIDEARTIVWNGPMGVFELPEFAAGTIGVAEAVAASYGYSVVGGGDSLAALKLAGVEDRIDHVSTGGGASLELLAGVSLPGIEALTPRSTA